MLMALTQVRAKIGGVWTVLTYDESIGKYKGTLTPPGTSVNQPGGYYSVEVEATNATGETTTLTGAQYKPLRLVVRETVSPTVALVSPPVGYLTNNSPTFTFSAQDEAGGSGIDTDSAQAVIDGVSVPCTVAQSGDGYSITIVSSGLSDGPHTVTVSISDRDGNGATASAAYTVDTVPPVLEFRRPTRHVVDWESIEVSGTVFDATSGVASVTVNGVAITVTGGGYSETVPLEVGENTITVVATDKAGLSTTKTLWILRLITDRTQADVDEVKALPVSWDDFTDAQKEFWGGVVRGTYKAEDMDRVGIAVEYLTDELQKRGYNPQTAPKTDWTVSDSPVEPQTDTYLENVEEIRKQLPVHAPPVPADMSFNFQGANAIEANLVEADRMYQLVDLSPVYSGECFSGEF